MSENKNPFYKIISKKYDRDSHQFIFSVEANDKKRFMRTAEEIAAEKDIITHMDFNDIFDIAYTYGYESIIKEQIALKLIKEKKT